MSDINLQCLDDDKYANHIKKIIQRDYFPYQKQIKVQNEILDRLLTENKNLTKIELESILNKKIDKKSKILLENENNKSINITNKLSLQEFVTKYVSEDEEDFQNILKKDEERHNSKFWWLKNDLKPEEKLLNSSNFDNQKIENKNRKNKNDLISIEKNENSNPKILYSTRKNHLMFFPERMSNSNSNKNYGLKNLPISENTRFKKPTMNPKPSKKSKLDNNTIFSLDSKNYKPPSVNGYQFVDTTPLIEPTSENVSPLVTWGTVEESPILLHDIDDDRDVKEKVNSFSIFEEPKEEKIRRELTRKIAKSKKLARDTPPRKNTPSYLYSISPAGRRLLEKGRGNHSSEIDDDLRKSYLKTPSSILTPKIRRTPSSIKIFCQKKN